MSGFDNINLYNGNLNFRLPLVTIGGRGSARYTMTLPVEQHWTTQRWPEDSYPYYSLDPDHKWWGASPGYSPGILEARSTGDGFQPCPGYAGWAITLTRLTFTVPDGTEYELRDQYWGGKPVDSPCGTGTWRGSVFLTADGSAATFFSDTPINDYNYVQSAATHDVYFLPSGNLYLRDGTRYRIDGGSVTWIRHHHHHQRSKYLWRQPAQESGSL